MSTPSRGLKQAELCDKITSLPDKELNDYLESLKNRSSDELAPLLSHVDKDGNNALMLALIKRKKVVSNVLSLLQRIDFPKTTRQAILSQANQLHAEGTKGFTPLMLAIHGVCSDGGDLSADVVPSLWRMMPKEKRPRWLAKQVLQLSRKGEYHGLNAITLAFSEANETCFLATSKEQAEGHTPAYICSDAGYFYYDGQSEPVPLSFVPRLESHSCLFLKLKASDISTLKTKYKSRVAYALVDDTLYFINKEGVIQSEWSIPTDKIDKVKSIFASNPVAHGALAQTNARTEIAAVIGSLELKQRFSVSPEVVKTASPDDLERILELTGHDRYLPAIQRHTIQNMFLTSVRDKNFIPRILQFVSQTA